MGLVVDDGKQRCALHLSGFYMRAPLVLGLIAPILQISNHKIKSLHIGSTHLAILLDSSLIYVVLLVLLIFAGTKICLASTQELIEQPEDNTDPGDGFSLFSYGLGQRRNICTMRELVVLLLL